jgi:hypothetical protein
VQAIHSPECKRLLWLPTAAQYLLLLDQGQQTGQRASSGDSPTHRQLLVQASASPRYLTHALFAVYMNFRSYHDRPTASIVNYCEARFAGLSPWFAPDRRGIGVVGGGGGHFGLVRRALCIFAPRSTPSKLLLTAVVLSSQGRVAAWPLAVAAEERQYAIPPCLS